MSRKNPQGWAPDPEPSLEVPCSRCHVPAGEPCRRTPRLCCASRAAVAVHQAALRSQEAAP